jgi:FkbM family methyltransferase
MKNAKSFIRSTLKRFGYRLVREDFLGNYGLEPFFRSLQRLGFSPKHIIDVGANRGVWTHTAVEYFPDALYTLVEPQSELQEYIRDLIEAGYKIRWLNVGVGDAPGQFPFSISHRDDSSTFAFQPAASDAGKQIVVEVKTLNQIVSASDTPMPDMVKIDAEGFDLKVLAGASDLFGKTEIFLVEAIIHPEANRENTLLEVIGRMARAGYSLFDVTDLNRSPKFGNLWLCELAFLRNGSPLLARITSYE